MNNLGISTDPALLDVELPRTLIESPSVSTFLPEEEASICPLLSTTNGTSTPLTFSHPLTPSCADNDSNNSTNLCNNEDIKAETGSTSGSSSGIGMEVNDSGATTLFSKHNYQHLQHNNGMGQDPNGNATNGNLKLTDDAPCFVSWNWPLIRKCTFFVFMSSLLAMVSVVITMIATMPKVCNPKTAWYRGSVFYEVFPASFQDSNNDGVGDLRGIASRIDYFSSMGISAVRLNSIFPSAHYPDDYEDTTSLTEIDSVLGTVSDLYQLSESLHARNISLILDLPLGKHIEHLGKADTIPIEIEEQNITEAGELLSTTTSTTTTTKVPQIADSVISQILQRWIELGVDGFYVKGLERFADEDNLLDHLAFWKHKLGKNRVLMVNEALIHAMDAKKRNQALTYIDLVDLPLIVNNGTKHIEEIITTILAGELAPKENTAWIHWTIGGVERARLSHHSRNENFTLAATLMQLMLPGTPSIFYGDEISLHDISDPRHEHNETRHLHHLATMHWSSESTQFTGRETLAWLPQTASFNLDHFALVSEMIKLRDRSPSIYKNSICKPEITQSNTMVLRSHDDILVVERTYPRRNTFVSVSNFGPKRLNLDMTAMFYSGETMLREDEEKIYFNDFNIGPYETIVVKVDK